MLSSRAHALCRQISSLQLPSCQHRARRTPQRGGWHCLLIPFSHPPRLRQEGGRPAKPSMEIALQMAWPSLQGGIISRPLCPLERDGDGKNTRQITEHELLIIISI